LQEYTKDKDNEKEEYPVKEVQMKPSLTSYVHGHIVSHYRQDVEKQNVKNNRPMVQ